MPPRPTGITRIQIFRRWPWSRELLRTPPCRNHSSAPPGRYRPITSIEKLAQSRYTNREERCDMIRANIWRGCPNVNYRTVYEEDECGWLSDRLPRPVGDSGRSDSDGGIADAGLGPEIGRHAASRSD